MVHLDIRPANIFIALSDSLQSNVKQTPGKPRHHRQIKKEDVSTGLLEGRYVIKIGDFGHVCRIDEIGFVLNEGETRYFAMELISSNETRSIDLTKADIFSVGASVYELCLGRKLASEGDEWRAIR